MRKIKTIAEILKDHEEYFYYWVKDELKENERLGLVQKVRDEIIKIKDYRIGKGDCITFNLESNIKIYYETIISALKKHK